VLRVMTLNIWNLSGPWRERRREIVAWIDHLDPDLVCLQEVVEHPDGRNQAAWLVENTGAGYAWAYGPGLVGEGGSLGNAVLSRWPIEGTAVVRLPAGDGPDEGRVLLHARTRRLDVFCTHLNWLFHHGYIRELQVKAIVDAIEARADPSSALPPVLAGDFNAEPDAGEIRFLTGLASLDGRSTYFQDAWRVGSGGGPGWTWDNRNPFAAAELEPDRRIDYVFVGWRPDGGAGRVMSARVVCDRALTGTFATDHFGLLAELADPGPAAPGPESPSSAAR
jgi:endonuclease/exonuclease/phosphatase family metal-dependent hydrolase